MFNKNNLIKLLGLVFIISIAGSASSAEYNISVGMDFSGPYAVVMKPFDEASRITFAWWNEEVGKNLGIKLNRKAYDTRYDPAVVASLWPGIIARDRPIAHLATGLPDIIPVLKRLPQDKVIIVTSSPSYGILWAPNQWAFQYRPTYMHEMAGLLGWLKMNKVKDRPIRFATFSSKKVPFYVELVDSLEEFAKKTPWVEFVGVEWIDVEPVSLISEMKRLVDKKPDFLVMQTNTYQINAALKAQRTLGVNIPVLLTTHVGIQMCTRASGDIGLLEGAYETTSVDPAIDMNTKGAKIYDEYKKKLNIDTPWNMMASQVTGMCIFVLRCVERAAKMKGIDNISGEDVYNAIFVKPFTSGEMLELTAEISFSKEASFPLKSKVKITTVEKGKQILVTKDWFPVPDVPKWATGK